MPCSIRGNDLGHFSIHLPAGLSSSFIVFFVSDFFLSNVVYQTSLWYFWKALKLGGNISYLLFRPWFFQIEAYELSLSFLGGQHLCYCCRNSGKRPICGDVLANLAACFFSPLGCAQYSVWVWEDLSAFFLCREAMRNEAMDLSYTTAWKNRPWPNK